MSTLPVVERILRDTKTPMSVREIVEHAGDTLPTKSKTPDTVVARDLSMDIKRKGDESLFARTSPGRYTMREYAVVAPDAPAPTESAQPETTEVLSSALSQERAGTRPAAEKTKRAESKSEMTA